MRKIMIMAAMLALVLAAAAPAFAQVGIISGDNDDVNQDVISDDDITQFTFAECINVASAVTGDQFAVNANVVSGDSNDVNNDQTAVNVGSTAVALQSCNDDFIITVFGPR